MPSTVIAALNYDAETHTLTIVYRGARGTYRYFDVPEEEYLPFDPPHPKAPTSTRPSNPTTTATSAQNHPAEHVALTSQHGSQTVSGSFSTSANSLSGDTRRFATFFITQATGDRRTATRSTSSSRTNEWCTECAVPPSI